MRPQEKIFYSYSRPKSFLEKDPLSKNVHVLLKPPIKGGSIPPIFIKTQIIVW
jgi:hypothetical protein